MIEIELRKYQEAFVNDLRSSLMINDSIIGQLPTGGGKTYTFAFIVKRAYDKGKKVLILTDRSELLTQAGGALSNVGLMPIKIQAAVRPSLNGSLYVAMSETLARRTENPDYQELLKKFDLVIIDEAHKRSFTKLFPFFREGVKKIGFTATPVRQGKADPLHETYCDIINGVDISYLIDNGFLARPNYYGVKADLNGVGTKSGDYDQNQVADKFSKAKLYRGVFQNWKEKCFNTKTLIFSSNVNSSLEIVEEFKSNGIEIRHLDGKTPAAKRRNILKWYHRTPNAVLSNVGVLTTGFDEPSVETIILYRATQSLSLYLQMVGRGSRTTDVKKEFNVLDFGNNIVTHGFWDDKRNWDFDTKDRKKKDKGEAVLKNCPSCEAFIPASTVVCPHCGHEDVKKKKEMEFARLQLLNPRDRNRLADTSTVERKAELCKQGLVKPFYVLHNLKKFEDVEKFVRLMDYKSNFLYVNHSRFWWSDLYLEKSSLKVS